MLYYPKIPGSRHAPDGRCVGFEKLDGTNLHWAWDRDLGWHGFGTRRDRFELTPAGEEEFAEAHPHLREAADVFRGTLADGVERVLRDHPAYQEFQAVTMFGEFGGPHSFAGLHKDDDPKAVRLFDVLADPVGLVGPDRFARDFGHLPSARVVYRGRLTGKFLEDVRVGRYDVAEGVVCKGGTGGADLWMVKVKTDAYLDRLKRAFADRWEEHWE